MNDGYYIAVTVIFGVFVILVGYWLYKSMRSRPALKDMAEEDWTDEDKEVLKAFCRKQKSKGKKK